jgi:cytochrome c-type biogenesis protein CcmH/NrfF
MQNRLPLRSKLILALVLGVSLAQSTVPLTNERVRRLGDQLLCKCGCQASITGCNMLNCHFSDPVRTELLKMVDANKSDKEIFDALVGEYGKDILLKPPSEGFYLLSWITPFAGIAAGLGVIWLFIRRFMRREAAVEAAGAAPPDSPELTRYREQIEKELEDLE